jgi:hypothetical protein
LPFKNSLFSFLELCLVTVMPVDLACVIDAMVCIWAGLFVHGVWSSEWAPKFLCLQVLFTGMRAKIFMFWRSVDGIVLQHLNLVPSSSRSFFTSTKFKFQLHTASFVFYINAEFQGMMCAQDCAVQQDAPQIFHDCHIS